jgi:Flp pilus assembly protein TadG
VNRDTNSFFRRVLRNESGAVAILVAVALPALVGLGALSVDAGYLFHAQRALQASADAAALAGAQGIGIGGAPITTATSYSSVSGDKNANPGFTVTSANLTATLKCYTSTGVPLATNQTPSTTSGCANGVNGIEVTEAASVPTFFARIFGVSSVKISATASASATGGTPQQLNVALILDTTKSMGSAPTGPAVSACSGYSTAIGCAAAGAQTLLGELWPCAYSTGGCGAVTSGNVANPVDEAALFVFPPVTNAGQAAADITCKSPTIATSYSGVSNTTSAATTTSTLSLKTSMTAATAFNTGSPWAVVTDVGTPTSKATPTTGTGSKTLTFPSGVITTHVATGLTIQDTTTPGAIASGTTVSSVSTTANTVTMSSSATGTGVESGDLITFGTSIPAGTGSWPWWGTGTTINTMTVPTTAVMSANPTGADVLLGDTIFVAPLYQIVGFSSDYRTSDTATSLNTASSDIVEITAKGCLGTPGGLGTYYADAISAAQNALVAAQTARVASGQPGGTNVIVLLSDGNASSTSTQMGPLKTASGECKAAVTAAGTAATAGTEVYTVYYDDNGTSSTCSTDTSPYNSACTTMQDIASDSTKFYSTDGTASPCASKNNYTTIAAIFQNIVASLETARLIPNNTI